MKYYMFVSDYFELVSSNMENHIKILHDYDYDYDIYEFESNLTLFDASFLTFDDIQDDITAIYNSKGIIVARF